MNEVKHFFYYTTKLGLFRTLEIEGIVWNPCESISFKRSLHIDLKGDHSPSVCIDIAFICIGLVISCYSTKVDDLRELGVIND